jgi:hypothetical protein
MVYNHYFIYNYGIYNHKYKCGQYQLGHKILFQKSELSLEEIIDLLINDQTRQILFYLHGYQADNYFFDRYGGYEISNALFEPLSSDDRIFLSLRWSSHPFYAKGIEDAEAKGKDFARILQPLFECCIKHNILMRFINHSMGNRVFFNMIWQFPLHYLIAVEKVFLIAADYNSEYFDEIDFPYFDRYIPDSKFYIYFRQDDTTLNIANKAIPYKRLGLYGSLLSHPMIQHRNCFGLDDEAGFVSHLFKHRYFYTSATVAKEILNNCS